MDRQEADLILNQLIGLSPLEIKDAFEAKILADALEVCFLEKRKDDVRAVIGACREAYPEMGKLMMVQAYVHLEDGAFVKATQTLDAIPADDDEFENGLELKGVVHMNNHQLPKAIAIFSTLIGVVEDEANLAYLHQQRAICHQYEKRFKEAADDLLKAMELFFYEDVFYQEFKTNLLIWMMHERNKELQAEAIIKAREICVPIVEEYVFWAPYSLLIECCLLENDLLRATQWLEEAESEEMEDAADDIAAFRQRVKNRPTVLEIQAEMDSLVQEIMEVPLPSSDSDAAQMKAYQAYVRPLKVTLGRLDKKLQKLDPNHHQSISLTYRSVTDQ